MAIYITGEKPSSIRELLKRLFGYKSDGVVKNIATFNDPECRSLQCGRNKYRSFDDVYELVTTYFPEATRSEVLKTLISLDVRDLTGRKVYFNMSSCMDIRRIVMYYSIASSDYIDGYVSARYNSNHSWRELLDEAGIRSQEEYRQVEDMRE